jgi:cyclophilin family peptidyl-prolyl cis-trans isomerase/HEAT repeat protein
MGTGVILRFVKNDSRPLLFTVICLLSALPLRGQTANRLSILQAEDRRASTARDLSILRAGARGRDGANTLIAVRALGRLERPALIGDLLPSLRHTLPEVRAEAANAIGQAAEGWERTPPPGALEPAIRALEARLDVEDVPSVRAVIFETLGRLPYTTRPQVDRIELLLIEEAAAAESIADRLGVAEGFEALVRRQRDLGPPSADAIAALVELSTPREGEATSGARIRRVALEALITTASASEELIRRSAEDPDAQVRRLAMRAASRLPDRRSAPTAPIREGATTLLAGLTDASPMVRLEAVRGLLAILGSEGCPFLIGALKDTDTHVNLMALDQLAACAVLADAVTALERAATDLSQAGSPRGWHRAAHALVALATASPERAAAALPQFVGSSVWQLRMYAARAAGVLNNRDVLERLAADSDDNVRETAIEALVKTAGHAADPVFVAALSRGGHQVLRAAALALAGTPEPERAIPALKSALQSLVEEGTDNGHDPRTAITATLAALGAPVPATPSRQAQRQPADFNADDLKRLAAPRARISIRGVGSFEIVLFTREAPATVLRFARLAEAGYYNGLTFHRIVPNFVIQGGSPGANEYVGDDWFMRDELGIWPHVRGALGISTRGRDTGDAQIFVNTVDNPRLDHDYTVFAQVLNGIDVVDLILEGDVIETIEIIP